MAAMRHFDLEHLDGDGSSWSGLEPLAAHNRSPHLPTMNSSQLVASAIVCIQMAGAETALKEFPELAAHRSLTERLEQLEDQLEEAQSRVRQIEKKIELTADQLRLAMGVEA